MTVVTECLLLSERALTVLHLILMLSECLLALLYLLLILPVCVPIVPPACLVHGFPLLLENALVALDGSATASHILAYALCISPILMPFIVLWFPIIGAVVAVIV